MKTTIQETGFESEDILQDNYPVYYGYAYLADKKVVQSHITGTVADLKRKLNASEIRRCNIVDRSKAPFFGIESK